MLCIDTRVSHKIQHAIPLTAHDAPVTFRVKVNTAKFKFNLDNIYRYHKKSSFVAGVQLSYNDES